ncbi:MAG: hypothetical protein IKM77_03170 [Prevotella sp.]|nr:hypothetical protein [Prevotella sp.]
MDIGICSIMVALITGISSIITAIIWGYIPKKRREEIIQLRKELLEVYIGVYNLKTVEENLEAELGMSKKTARKGLIITDRLQKNKIEKRIAQLNSSI